MLKPLYTNNKETIHNFIWRSIQIFGKQGITFLIFIICAKLLAPYEFGIYNYALAIIFFLIIFGDFGISTATSKYVAEYNATDKRKLKLVLFNSGIIILSLTIIVTLITLLFGKWYLQDKYIYVLYLLPLIFLAPMTSLYDGIYRGLKKFKQLAIISVIIGLFSLTFVYFLINQYGLIGALIAQNIFYLLLFLGLAFGYRDFKFKFDKVVMKEVGIYGLYVGFAIIGYYLFSRIDILILGHYGYINEIATYELINKFFLIFLVPFSILGQVIAPNFTELYAKRKYENLFRTYKKSLIISSIIAIIYSILAVSIILLIIKFFFSIYYNELFFIILIPCVIIFTLQFFNAPINSGIIIPTGYASLMTYLNIIMGPINLLLSLTLIHYFGFIGVIYSTMITNILGNLILQVSYYKKIKNKK